MQCPGGMDYVAQWQKSSQPPFSAGSVCRVIIPDGRNELGSGSIHISRVLEDKCFFSHGADSVLFSVFRFGISVMLPCILSQERWGRVFIFWHVEGITGSPNPGERAGIG